MWRHEPVLIDPGYFFFSDTSPRPAFRPIILLHRERRMPITAPPRSFSSPPPRIRGPDTLRVDGLAWLFGSLFGRQELLDFLRKELPKAELPDTLLTAHSPDHDPFSAMIRRLEASDLVDDALFAAIGDRFPERREDVVLVAGLWLGRSPQAACLAHEDLCRKLRGAEALVASSWPWRWNPAGRLLLHLAVHLARAEWPEDRLRPLRQRVSHGLRVVRRKTVRFHDLGGGPVLRWRAGRVFAILAAVFVIAAVGALALFPDLPRGRLDLRGHTHGPATVVRQVGTGAEPPPEASPPPPAAAVPTSTKPAHFSPGQQGEAETCVRNMVWDAYPEGWAVRTVTTARLAEMEHRIYMLTLYAGNEYRIVSCGDKSMVNADLVLYDADGRLILQDLASNRQPILSYKPEQTDTFYIAVHATERVHDADDLEPEEKAGIALAVTYK